MKHLIKKLIYFFPFGKSIWLCASNIKFSIRAKRYARMRKLLLQKYGAEVIQRVNEALKGLDVKYFADYGTLLGICREKGFIKHDDDIDFSVLPNCADPVDVAKCLLKSGFKFLRAFELNGIITELSFVWNGVNVDFFFMFKERDEFITYFFERNDGNYEARYWDALSQVRPNIKNLSYVKILQASVPVPDNWDEVLTMAYGNWRVPKKSTYNNNNTITQLNTNGTMLTCGEVIDHKRGVLCRK